MPEYFLTLRVHEPELKPGKSGLCVGFEKGEWRAKQFVDNAMEFLPEFALSNAELESVNSTNFVKLLKKAAYIIYKTKKFEKRGEFGELFLHIAVKQAFSSIPAISKIFYKSAENETVKGFDAVHVVEADDGLELWLGEVKFYKDFRSAVYEVVEELVNHLETDYLRSEFILISNKIDPNWEYAEDLLSLLKPEVSLDDVFKRLCVPVLITYDSEAINSHSKCDEKYHEMFCSEVEKNYQFFSSKKLPTEVRIHLFLLPIKSKEDLVKLLHDRLEIWQKL